MTNLMQHVVRNIESICDRLGDARQKKLSHSQKSQGRIKYGTLMQSEMLSLKNTLEIDSNSRPPAAINKELIQYIDVHARAHLIKLYRN